MKLTKLMALALVLVMLVSSFVACGGTTDTETQAPETQAPETQAPESETDEPGGDPAEVECNHEIVVEETLATCIERGYRKETCSLCGEVIVDTAYPKAPHTVSGPVTCETDSKCTVCGEIFEAATGHVFEEVIEEVPATCTSEGSQTGVCTVCGELKTVVLPTVHVVEGIDDFSTLTFVNGKIQGTCSDCQQVVDVTGDVRLQLNFDKSTLQEEIEALATEENGLAYDVVYEPDQNPTNISSPAVSGSVLTLPHNKSAAISFNAALLKDAQYYVISFDWCVNGSGTSRKIGVVALAESELFGGHAEKEYNYALWVDRSNGALYKGDQGAGWIADSKVTDSWQHIDILVDNSTGNNYVYIDGEFFADNMTDMWRVTGDGKYTLRFGGCFNVYHQPKFDNVVITAVELSTEGAADVVLSESNGCDHRSYLEYMEPTDTAPGYVRQVCYLCGEVENMEIFHDCNPNAPASCTTDSVCVICGEVLERAFGHSVDPAVTPVRVGGYDCTGPLVRVGTCLTCGGQVEEMLAPAEPHTFKISNASDITVTQNGNTVVFTAKCSVCGQTEEVNLETLLALGFDQSTVKAEVESKGLSYGTIYESGQSSKPEPNVEGGVMKIGDNQSAGISFDAELLKKAEYYVVSFDWCITDAAGGERIIGVIGLADSELFGQQDYKNYASALWVDRNSGLLYATEGKQAGKIADCKVAKDSWQHVDILVDNNNGNCYVYIDGVFFAADETGMWLVKGEGKYTLRLGGSFNVYHKPKFDNVAIAVLETDCIHANTSLDMSTSTATCTQTGEADKVCNKCGYVEKVPVDMLPHVPSDVLVIDGACATVYECQGCGDANPVVVAKENAVHTAPTPTNAMKDGKVQGVCVVCGLTVDATDITEEVRLKMDFAEGSLAGAVSNAVSNGLTLTYGEIYDSNQSGSGKPWVGANHLRVDQNKSAGFAFNAALLKDADYYIVSFDWGINATGSGSNNIFGVVALADSELLGAHTESEYDYALYVNRSSLLIYKGDKGAGAIADCKVPNRNTRWQHVDILVNNTTGHNYVYIDGEFFAANETGNWKVDGDGQYTLRFGGQFNVTHKPYFDNITITAITATADSN